MMNKWTKLILIFSVTVNVAVVGSLFYFWSHSEEKVEKQEHQIVIDIPDHDLDTSFDKNVEFFHDITTFIEDSANIQKFDVIIEQLGDDVFKVGDKVDEIFTSVHSDSNVKIIINNNPILPKDRHSIKIFKGNKGSKDELIFVPKEAPELADKIHKHHDKIAQINESIKNDRKDLVNYLQTDQPVKDSLDFYLEKIIDNQRKAESLTIEHLLEIRPQVSPQVWKHMVGILKPGTQDDDRIIKQEIKISTHNEKDVK